MTQPVFRYPYDPTGRSPGNLVANEGHTLDPRPVRAFAPVYGPFFTESVVLYDALSEQILQRNVHYQFGELYQDLSVKLGKEICGVVVIPEATVNNQVVINYQTVGGNYQRDLSNMINSYLDALNNAHGVDWNDLINKPLLYPPVLHAHALLDIYGFEAVVSALERVVHAITLSNVPAFEYTMDYVNSRMSTLFTGVDEADIDSMLPVTKLVTFDKLLYALKHLNANTILFNPIQQTLARPSTSTITMTSTNVESNTHYYWTIHHIDTTADDFGSTSGLVGIDSRKESRIDVSILGPTLGSGAVVEPVMQMAPFVPGSVYYVLNTGGLYATVPTVTVSGIQTSPIGVPITPANVEAILGNPTSLYSTPGLVPTIVLTSGELCRLTLPGHYVESISFVKMLGLTVGSTGSIVNGVFSATLSPGSALPVDVYIVYNVSSDPTGPTISDHATFVGSSSEIGHKYAVTTLPGGGDTIILRGVNLHKATDPDTSGYYYPVNYTPGSDASTNGTVLLNDWTGVDLTVDVLERLPGYGGTSVLYSVVDLVVVDPGSPWVGAPDITFTGSPTPATATTYYLDPDRGNIELMLDTGGSGYMTPPDVLLSGGGGTGLIASCKLGNPVNNATGEIQSCYVDNTLASDVPWQLEYNGVLLPVDQAWAYPDGPGTGAVIRTNQLYSTEHSGYVITSVAVDQAGYGYTSDLVFRAKGSVGGVAVYNQIGVEVNVIYTAGWSVTGIVVEYPGTGWTSAPTVLIAGSSTTTATAHAVYTPSTITYDIASVNVLQGGQNYLVPPTINITGGGGSNAVLEAVLSTPPNTLIDVNVINPGVGFTSPPSLTVVNANVSTLPTRHFKIAIRKNSVSGPVIAETGIFTISGIDTVSTTQYLWLGMTTMGPGDPAMPINAFTMAATE